MSPIHTETLANGLILEFFDRSNRYFGDYWHLHLELHCRLPLAAAGLAPGEYERIRTEIGETVEFIRHLERMGVPSVEVPVVRQKLIDSFLASARPYMESPAFPARLVAARCAEWRHDKRSFRVIK